MKALVVYDSQWGNTEKVARAIAAALGPEPEVRAVRAGQVTPEMLAGSALDLLVVGSPTQGFRPTKPLTELLSSLSPQALDGVRVAAFDTRFDADRVSSRVTRFVVRRGGYAAPRIAEQLEKAGGALVAPPEGFFVADKEGPLFDGELERAAAWAGMLPGTV